MAILLMYYENSQGHIQLPPDEECFRTVCPPGYQRKEAHYLHEVDKVKDRLEADERRRLQADGERENALMQPKIDSIRDRIFTRMKSSATTAYEKEFLELYLKLSDDRKRENYRKRFAVDTAYMEMREFDRKRSPEEVRKDLDL